LGIRTTAGKDTVVHLKIMAAIVPCCVLSLYVKVISHAMGRRRTNSTLPPLPSSRQVYGGTRDDAMAKLESRLHDSDVGCPVSSHISPSTSLCLPALALVGVLGWRVNYFAASSALSLPSTPACAGVHLKLVCTPFSSSLYINLVIIIIWACFEPWL
jgi:hypothetical protein